MVGTQNDEHCPRASLIKLEDDPPPPVWEATPAPARTIMTRSQARARDQTVKREDEALWRGMGRKWDLDQILAAAAARRAAEAVQNESSEPPALEKVPGPAGEPSTAGEENHPNLRQKSDRGGTGADLCLGF